MADPKIQKRSLRNPSNKAAKEKGALAAAPQNNDAIASESTGEEAASTVQKAPTVTYSISGGFVALLARLNISVALSSYQSGKFYLLGRNPQGGLMVNERLFQKAMGLHVAGNTLLLATLFQISAV